MTETKFDEWLEAHPTFDKYYTELWVRTIGRYRRFVGGIKTRWHTRKYKPGGYFLDHGYTPAVITKVDDGGIWGISMVDGSSVMSDYYHCGPDVVCEKEAYKVLAVLKKMRVE